MPSLSKLEVCRWRTFFHLSLESFAVCVEHTQARVAVESVADLPRQPPQLWISAALRVALPGPVDGDPNACDARHGGVVHARRSARPDETLAHSRRRAGSQGIAFGRRFLPFESPVSVPPLLPLSTSLGRPLLVLTNEKLLDQMQLVPLEAENGSSMRGHFPCSRREDIGTTLMFVPLTMADAPRKYCHFQVEACQFQHNVSSYPHPFGAASVFPHVNLTLLVCGQVCGRCIVVTL